MTTAKDKALAAARLCAEELLKDPDDERVIVGIYRYIPLESLYASQEIAAELAAAVKGLLGDGQNKKDARAALKKAERLGLLPVVKETTT